MDQNMNLGNSSPDRPAIFINYLDPAPPVAAEQSFLDISIKDEPLQITDNDSSEDSTEADSRNDTVQDNSSDHIDNFFQPLTNADSIYEGIMQCDSDTDFSDGDCENFDDGSNDRTYPEPEGPLEDSLLLEDNTFSCSMCSFTTDKQGRLRDHERNHRKLNMPIFECIYCSQRYTRNLLYLHVLNVHPGQKFQIRDVMPSEAATTPSHNCSRCSYSTKYRENLTLHMKTHYFKIGKSIDRSPFYDNTKAPSKPMQAELIATEKSPAVEKVLQCPACVFSTSERVTFTLHKRTHFEPIKGHDATGRAYVNCRICSYSCGTINSMDEHIDSHINSRPINQCVNCEFKSTPIALSWHVKKCRKRSVSYADPDRVPKRMRINQALVKASKDIVTVKTSLQCKTCAFSTKDKLKFKLHVNKHLFEPVKRPNASGITMYYCKMCSYFCNNFGGALGHINSHKLNLPIVKCTNCDFKSTTRAVKFHQRTSCQLGNVKDVSDEMQNSVKSFDVIQAPAATPSQWSNCTLSATEESKLKRRMNKHLFEPVKRIDPSGCTMYYCKICSYSCHKLRAVLPHINTHKRNLPIVKCTNCDFKSTPRAVKFHQRNCQLGDVHDVSDKFENSVRSSDSNKVSSATRFQCSSCTFSTIEESTLKRHINKHLFEPVKRIDASGHTMYHCKMCSYICDKLNGARSHINTHKLNLPIIKCTSCDFKSTPRAVKLHKQNCKLENVKGVSDAVQNSIQSSDFNKTPSATHFQCSTSAVSTTEESKLKMHTKKRLYEPVKRIDASGRILYYCKICSYFCKKLKQAFGHINSHKLNLPIVKCTNCDFKSTPRAVKFHQRPCKLGNVKYVSDKVQNSVRSSDSNEVSSATRFQCSSCTFSTTDETKLKMHTKKHLFEPIKRTFPTGRSIYQCKMCSYGSCKFVAILSHLNLHKRNKPIIKCTNCDFKSTSRSVKFHQRNCKLGNVKDVHEVQNSVKNADSNETSSISRFQCPTCPFSTTDERKFKLHANKHLFEPDIVTDSSEVKVYKCRMCSYISGRPTQIIGHINTHRSNLPIVSCSYCEFQSTSRAVKFHQRNCTRNTESATKGTVKDVSSEVKIDRHTEKFSDSDHIPSTTDQLKLKTHTNKHRFEPDIVTDSSGFKVYQCRMCSFSTKKAHAIIGHIKSHKNNFPIVSCSNCDFKSTARAVLFHSQTCGFKSPTKENMQNLSGKVDIDKCLTKSSYASKRLFKCSICTFSSTEKVRLNIHIMNKHRFDPEVSDLSSLKIHHCDVCDYTTNKAGRIIPHRKTHEGDAPLVECSNCDYKSTSRAVKFHMRLSCGASPDSPFVKDTKNVSTDTRNRKVYQCKLCSYGSKLVSRLTMHLNSHKRNFAIVGCPNCNYKSTKRAVRYHLLKCRAAKSLMGKAGKSKHLFACPTCSFSTPLRIKFKLHIKKHHVESENKPISENSSTSVENPTATSESLTTNFKCKFCPFASNTGIGYHNHMRTHADKVFKCNLCSFVSSKKNAYSHHMTTHENNQPIKKCRRCNFRATPRLLLRHIVIENHGKEYKCKVCSIVCTNRVILKRHMTTHQLRNPVKKCLDCGLSSSGSDLLPHNCAKDQPKKDEISNDSKDVETVLTRISTKEKNRQVEITNSTLKKSLFRCAECSFVTCLRIKLNIHTKKYHQKLIGKRSTKSGKIHKCGDCSYVTVNASNLRRHVVTQHLKPKRRTIKKCRKCDFRSTTYELRIHSRKCQGDQIENNTMSLSEGAESSDGNQSSQVVERDDSMIENTVDISQDLGTARDNSIEDTNDVSASTSQGLECCLCPLTTFRRDSLKLHVEVIHSRQLTSQDMFKEVYACPICDFTTLYKAKMGDHRENTKHNSTNVSETNPSSLSDKESVDASFEYCSSKDSDDQNNITIVLDTKSRVNSDGQAVYHRKRHMDLHVEKAVGSRPDQLDAELTKQSSCKNKSDEVSGSNSKSNRENISKIAKKRQVLRKNRRIKQCPNCSYRSTANALSLHLLKCPDSNESNSELSCTKTKDLEVYKCDFCSYTSTVKGSLTRHLNTHVIEKQPVKQCENCDFKGTRSILEIHGPICPNKDKPKQLLKCSECSYTSYLPEILKNHESKTHRKKEIKTSTCPKIFKCEFCSFTSFWQYLIERHMNSHTLLKLPIEQCTKCDFRSTPSALAAHINNMCTKKSSVLADVSANNSPSKKLKLRRNSDLDDGRHEKKVQDNDNDKISEVGLSSSDDELKRKSPTIPEIVSSNVEVYINDRKVDEVNIEKESNIVDPLAISPPKTAFNCPKCSFSTLLRIKLKVHIEKTHMDH